MKIQHRNENDVQKVTKAALSVVLQDANVEKVCHASHNMRLWYRNQDKMSTYLGIITILLELMISCVNDADRIERPACAFCVKSGKQCEVKLP